MVTIKSVVDTYLFYNEDSGYGVLKLEDGTTAVGILPKLSFGDTIELEGAWTNHPKYGEQLKVEKFKVFYPTSKEGMIKYLGSGLIKGVGEVTARRIVRYFGERTFEILEGNIERLNEIDGIGGKKIEQIKHGWEEQKGIKDVMIALQSYGIPTSQIVRIYKVYGDKTVKVIENNPYRLTYDVWGIGFKIADEIGKKVGFLESNPNRIKSGILYILNEASRSGHVYLPELNLLQNCREILNYELSQSDPLLTELEEEGQIIRESDKIYLASLFYAEIGISESLKNLMQFPNRLAGNINQSNILSKINTKFSEEQLKAINFSLSEKILIITGGPGTGKTETLKGIIKIYEGLGKKIMLSSPTGRAAKHMGKVIGREAKTIHRLLEYNPSGNFFNFNNENKLKTDLLVVDEVSMIDTYLMYNLLSAVDENTVVVLVGDVDQLPSIGPGNVLKDLINSNRIPSIKLTKIFRQAEQSKIIIAAHDINKGNFPEIINSKSDDIFFLEENDDEKIPEIILDLCRRRLPEAFNFNPLSDIQVLTPMHRGVIGTSNLNKVLQTGLNQNQSLLKKGSTEFKLFDKVMQLRNNYDKNIFNGDMGFIHGYDSVNHVMKIDFGNKLLKYELADLDEITLAYSITVHKSQGSEYPCVIIPLSTSHYTMLYRNLLYTAVTRAVKLLILIGSPKALSLAIKNNRIKKRFTSLFKQAGN